MEERKYSKNDDNKLITGRSERSYVWGEHFSKLLNPETNSAATKAILQSAEMLDKISF